MLCGTADAPTVKVYYWQGFQGRGWAIRLYTRAIGLKFEEAFLDGGSEVGGMMAKAGFASKDADPCQGIFAPPAIEVGGKKFCQVVACMHHLAKISGNAPIDVNLATKDVEIALTCADILSEMFTKMRNKDKREEFLGARMTKFMRYFESNANKEGKFLLGDKPGASDGQLASTIRILVNSTDEAYVKGLRETYPRVMNSYDNFFALDGVKAYLSEELFTKNGGEFVMAMPDAASS